MDQQIIAIYKKFVYQWVALSDTYKVVASGASIEDVEKKLKAKHQLAEEIRYISPLDKSYAPLCL